MTVETETSELVDGLPTTILDPMILGLAVEYDPRDCSFGDSCCHPQVTILEYGGVPLPCGLEGVPIDYLGQSTCEPVPAVTSGCLGYHERNSLRQRLIQRLANESSTQDQAWRAKALSYILEEDPSILTEVLVLQRVNSQGGETLHGQ